MEISEKFWNCCTVKIEIQMLVSGIYQKNANYQSQESQNELLKVVADTISKTIVKDIKASSMFSIIADEARGVSCSEQMSICIRFVKEDEVYERFLRFVNVHELNALSLAADIVRNLQELGLALSQCVAQCYDGAAVMSGRCQRVQVHVREQCKLPCL